MSKKITGYAPIFEQKLDRLKKDIKRLRKEKATKERIKKCIHEAKGLKALLKEIKPSLKELHLHIELNDDNEPIVVDKHPLLDIMDIYLEYGTIKIILRLQAETTKI